MLQIVVNSDEGSVRFIATPPPFGGGWGEAYPHIALLHVHLQLLLQRAPFTQMDRGHDDEARPLAVLLYLLHHVFRRVLFHLLTADGRIGVADAGIEQAQILVDLRRGAYRRARIARDHLLLDGDGRRYAAYVVALRLVHAAEELAGIA